MLLFLYLTIFVFLLLLFVDQIIEFNQKYQQSKFIYTSYSNIIYRIKAHKLCKIRCVHTHNSTNTKIVNEYEVVKDIYNFIKNNADKSYTYVTTTHKGIYSLIKKESERENPTIKILFAKERKSNIIERICYKKSYKQIRGKVDTKDAYKNSLFDTSYFIVFKIL